MLFQNLFNRNITNSIGGQVNTNLLGSLSEIRFKYLHKVILTFFIFMLTLGSSFGQTNLTQSGFTGVIVPQYASTGTSTRLPIMFRATITGLTASTSYRYYVQAAISTSFGTANSGAGNPLLINAAGTTYSYTTTPGLTTAGTFETFTTDASGNYTGWFGFVNSGNAIFAGGTVVFPTITTNGGGSGTAVVNRRALDLGITGLAYSTSAGANNGSFIRQTSSSATAKNMALLYDNTAGTGRPLYISPFENISATIASVPTGYSTGAGAWNAIIPNTNANGVRRIEHRSVTSNSVIGCATDADGIWPTGSINTVNPTSGTTVITINGTDAPLNSCASGGTITGAATATAFTTTYGTASAAQTFPVSGSGLTANITATAPAGCEVSNDGTTYGATTTFTQSGGTASGTLSVRLAATATVAGFYNSQNIVLSSAGATSVNVTTAASGNLVSPKELTVTGVTATNKEYDATATASITGSTLVGIVGADVVTVNGTGTFATANVGTAIVVTSTQTLAGANAGNYTLTLPTGLTADITAKPITISGLTANNKAFDGTTTATLSGTPTLVGVIAADVANVVLGGTYIANFVSAAVGTGIAVTVTGYTISGSAATNYALTQPTGLTANITATATPNITSALTATETYGVAITTYTITATETPTSFNATGLPAGLTVNTTTGEITGTATVVGTFNATIYATNAGGTGSAILTYTINQKPLTVSGAMADNKVYNRLNAATISGSTLVGIVGADVVTISNTGTFASANAGTAIAVTSTQTLGGADAAKYTITIPTGLTADITAKALTIASATAQNKAFDGTTTATITGTLAGVISPDVVTLSLSGTFASAAAGAGIAVTSTSTIAGADVANYSLTQPTGLTANITTPLVAGDVAVIGYSTTGSTVDNLSLLILKDLGAGTVFYVNDNEVATAGGTAFTDLAEAEASFTVNAGQTILAGTVVVLPWGAAAVTTTAYTWSTTGSAGFGSNNDEIYVYSAPSITSATPTAFIYFAKIGTSSSAIPSGLTLGTTSIAPSGGALRYATAGATYSACAPVLLSAIGNTTTNWNATGATTVAAADWTFSVLPACATPTITATGTLTALSTEYGTASSTTTFTASAVDLTTNLIITAPAGFEVSSNNTTFSNSVTLTPTSGTVATTTIYVRLAANAPVASSPFTGNVDLTSTGATTVSVATLSSTVTAKALTITGITANNKIFDGNTSATLSGTPSLVGVVNADVVTLGGTAVANFASSAVGTGIAVSVTGYTIAGAGAGNYTLTQPSLTADITASASPMITSALTATETYGVAITTYTITATETPSSFNATGLPAGLTVNTSTGEITGTSTVVGTFNVTISATNIGGTGTATLVYTINPKPLTVTGAIADNKIYDRTNAATISGSTLVGVVGTDVVTISNTGTFASINVSTAIAVTSTQTLSGADAAKYTVTIPTGLSADITTKALTIASATAQNKFFDGNTNAIITGTLTGVIAPDAVTLTLSGTFASAAVGTGIAVTSTSSIAGLSVANYSLTQPTGLTANIITAPTFTEVIFPQYIQGLNGTNNNRIPFAYRATLADLTPNATYRFYNAVDLTTALPNANGAGNNIFTGATQGNNFTYSTGPSLNTAGNFGTFTTDATGAYTGWFIIAPSSNATRFVPGNILNTRIILNDGNGGTTVSTILKSNQTIQVINTVASAGANNGTGLWGSSSAIDKNFVFVYDNTAGNGRPLSGTFVENDGAAQVASFATFYTTNVNGVSGAYGLIVPNTNANGVQRIEQRDFTTGALIGCPATDADGVWPSGANTVNPTGGTTAIVITSTDANLNNAGSENVTTISSCDSYTWANNGITYTTSGMYTGTTTNCITEKLNLTITTISVTASATNVTCSGLADGTITASATGGATITVNGSPLANPYGPGTYTIVATAPNASGTANCTATTTVTITEPAPPSITASANAGGTINPTGTITLACGASQTYTFAPSSGFQIVSLLINGVNNPAAASAGSYTFTNVTGGQTIQAVFQVVGTTAAASIQIETTNYRGAFAPAPTRQWTADWTNFNPQNTVYGTANVAITSDITTSTTWTSNNVYSLTGVIYVNSGVTLTIEPGTIIRGNGGNSSLLVARGGKLIAEGTQCKPIVFTSNQAAGARAAGDWGGVLLLGSAKHNLGTNNLIEGLAAGDARNFHGGTDDADNSGVLKYVRIEYAGFVFSANNEINGLTLGSVGNGTTLDYIQVTRANDDAFEFFGGSVFAKHLIAYQCLDDDLDTDNGYSGTVQFALCIKDPNFSDASQSEGFESDNQVCGVDGLLPKTSAKFLNITQIGAFRCASNAAASGVAPTALFLHRRGARVRRNSDLKIQNSILMNNWRGLFVDNASNTNAPCVGITAASTSNNYNQDSAVFRNNIIAGDFTTTWTGTTYNGTTSLAWENAVSRTIGTNTIYANDSVNTCDLLVDPWNANENLADFRPNAGVGALVSNPALASVGADLNPVLAVDNPTFNANQAQDVLIPIVENGGGATNGAIVLVVFKPAGWDITFNATATNSNFGGGTPITNSDWTFVDNGASITITSKPGTIIDKAATVLLGVTATRKAATGAGTTQTLNADISGGGDILLGNNGTLLSLSAN